MIQTVEAIVEPGGEVRLLGEVHLASPHRAILTVLDVPVVDNWVEARPVDGKESTNAAELAQSEADQKAWAEFIANSSEPKFGTGAEAVEFWRKTGVIGSRADIVDPVAHARAIREKAQRRERT